MARKFDPDNLSAGDVLKAFTSIAFVIAALVLVGRYAPNYAWLLVLIVPVIVYFWVANLPREELKAIAEKEIEFQHKIESIPFVGGPAGIVWKAINWIGVFLGAIMLVLVAVAGISKLL